MVFDTAIKVIYFTLTVLRWDRWVQNWCYNFIRKCTTFVILLVFNYYINIYVYQINNYIYISTKTQNVITTFCKHCNTVKIDTKFKYT